MRNETQSKAEFSVVLIICIVNFITPFMSAGVGVALPNIGEYYSASVFQLSLTSMFYLVGVVVFLLPAGQLADIFGRKKIFVIGLISFVFTCFTIIFCPNIESFLVIRLFQGFASALIITASMAILASVIPPQRRGRSMGFVVAFVYAGLSAGPALGGVIVAHFDWRYLFLFTAIVSFLILLLTAFRLKGEWFGAKDERFDWFGSVLFATSLTIIILVTTTKSLVSTEVIWLGLVLSFLCFVLFFWIERRSDSPVLDVKVLASNHVLLFTSIASLLNYAASFGIIFFFSLYLQSVKHLSPSEAGMLLMVQTLMQCVLSPFVGRLADKIYPGTLATIGMSICAIALAFASNIDMESSLTTIFFFFISLGGGFALFSSPNNTLIMNSVHPKLYGMASSLTGLVRNIGILCSMTISTLLVESYMGDAAITDQTASMFVDAMQTGMMIFAVLGVFGVFFSMGRSFISK
ncbi:MAG: MFS transporter [Desulfotalea sp.]